MGRKKLNKSKDELLEQQRIRARRYYNKHKSKLNKESLDRYYNNKAKTVVFDDKNSQSNEKEIPL